MAHHEKVFRHLPGMTKHVGQYLNQRLPEYEAVLNFQPQTLLYTSFLINQLGRYAKAVDQLAVQNVAQGAPLGGGSTYFAPILLSQI